MAKWHFRFTTENRDALENGKDVTEQHIRPGNAISRKDECSQENRKVSTSNISCKIFIDFNDPNPSNRGLGASNGISLRSSVAESVSAGLSDVTRMLINTLPTTGLSSRLTTSVSLAIKQRNWTRGL